MTRYERITRDMDRAISTFAAMRLQIETEELEGEKR